MKKLKENVINYISGLWKLFLDNLYVIIFGIALCFFVCSFFGLPMIAVAVVSVITVKQLYNTTLSFMNYVRYAVILFGIVLLGSLASMNFLVGFLINLVFIAVVMFIFGDNFFVGNSFIFALQLLIMQYQGGIYFGDLLMRLLCCICCILVGGIFLVLMNNLFLKHKDNKYVVDGCKAVANKLNFLLGKKLETDSDLFTITTDFCKSKYASMINQLYVMDESSKYDLMSLMTLEQMSDLVYETTEKLGELSDEDIEYFTKLKDILNSNKNLRRISIALDDFAETYSLSNVQMSSLWKKYISTLIKYIKHKMKPSMKSDLKKAIAFRKSVLGKRISRKSPSYNLRSALQTAIIVSICGVLGQILPISCAEILPLSALAIFSIYPNQKMFKTIPYFIGVSVVIAFYFAALSILPFGVRFVVALIISMIGLFVSKSIFLQMTFLTQIITTIVAPASVVSPEILFQIIFIVVSVLICVLLSRFIFNTPSYRIRSLQMADLAQLNWSSVRLLESIRFSDSMSNYLCEFMLIQHLMVEHLSNSNAESSSKINRIRYSGMLSFNCDLLTEIAYAMTILKPNKLPYGWVVAMKKRLSLIFD